MLSSVIGRCEELRKRLTERGIWVYVLSCSDVHGSEEVAEEDRWMEALSGFTGDNGVLIVPSLDYEGLDQPIFWSDSRFHLQAGEEVPAEWHILTEKSWIPTLTTYLERDRELFEEKGAVVALDPASMSVNSYYMLQGAGDFVRVADADLLDGLWDRPVPKKTPATVVGAGVFEDARSKIERVREKMDPQTDALFVSNLAEIGWLLNIRGDDIPCSPVVKSFLLLFHTNETESELFVDAEKVEGIREYLRETANIVVRPYESMTERVCQLLDDGVEVIGDEPLSVVATGHYFKAGTNPGIAQMMSFKTPGEIAAFREAHILDAVAYCRAMADIEQRFENGQKVTELDIVAALETYRNEIPSYRGPSFRTIVGAGKNGAVVHYVPKESNFSSIDRNDVVLVDFGCHFACMASTDTTRTVCFGTPTEFQKCAYTNVLRAAMHVMMAQFTDGETGDKLDCIAHAPLRKYSMDYKHGTGHGICNCLCIHEYPFYSQRFSFRRNQVVTVEPGVYVENEFGVRIENVCVVVPHDSKPDTDVFECITVAPISTNLVDKMFLTELELEWLNAFNEHARQVLTPYLEGNARDLAWLIRNTEPLY